MTTLTFSSKKLFGPRLGGAGAFPGMRVPLTNEEGAALSESDGLFIDYGNLPETLPFTMQDQYDSAPVEQTFKTAILENDFLKATFVLELGARLWSLYDKAGQRELLLSNAEFRPNNLAIRNAWFAGGIEYNIGRRGHDPQTCSPRFAATLKDTDGTPVLRIYEFCRDRAVPFQIDFYLPAASHFLLARVRIENTRPEVIPMYWWSNLAVPQLPGCRIVLPAFQAYARRYNQGRQLLSRIPIPDGEGFDATYPGNFPATKDHFYIIPDDTRKFETVFQADGRGILLASTRRLQGRKLFVWGQNAGSQHWQRKLMAPENPNYLEIQGGLAKTQQECLPMPPKTAWEWLEAYGAVALPPQPLFGEWGAAVQTVSAAVEQLLPEKYLDSELERTRDAFAKRPGVVVQQGSGWGALEERRLGHKLTAHLDFGAPGAEQADWLQLLEQGTMPAQSAPNSYLVQPEWRALLRAAQCPNWKTRFHLALQYFRMQEYDRAEAELNAALAEQKDNPWCRFALANVYRATGRVAQALDWLDALVRSRPEDASLAKEVLLYFIEAKGSAEQMLAICDALAPAVREKPMLQFCRAHALAHLGRLEEAEAILTRNGGLEISDIQEGVISLTTLYLYIQQEKNRKLGRCIPEHEIPVPFALELRPE